LPYLCLMSLLVKILLEEYELIVQQGSFGSSHFDNNPKNSS